MLQLHRDTNRCGYLCTLYWLHTRSGKKKTQLATACKSEQAEKGDKLFYCYTLTRKNLEVKHHREKQTANMTEMQRWHHACYQSRGFSHVLLKQKGYQHNAITQKRLKAMSRPCGLASF